MGRQKQLRKFDVGPTASRPKVIVFSDYICPFCFIGKSSIDRLRKEFDVEVEWRNIEIHPETPLNGIPRSKIDASFFGRIWSSVQTLAAESGIEIRPPPILSNSSLALIASEYAKQEGKFEAFHDAAFRAYWQEGKNIGDINVLLDIARIVGLDSSALKAYFTADGWAAAIEGHRRSASEHDVAGVPTFIIGKAAIVGARPYEEIREIFLKAFTSSRLEFSEQTGEICEDTCKVE